MQFTRRAVVAASAAALAGCGRSLRENTVPGGLVIQNRDDVAHSVRVRAWTVEQTATPVDETTPPRARADAQGRFEVSPTSRRGVPDFFPGGGRWVVRASVDGGEPAKLTVRLYDAVPGPAGADTVFVRVGSGGSVSLDASHVD